MAKDSEETESKLSDMSLELIVSVKEEKHPHLIALTGSVIIAGEIAELRAEIKESNENLTEILQILVSRVC